MLKVIRGNTEEEWDVGEFKNFAEGYDKVVVDVGTGDGRFVFKSAQENNKTLFIGLDPSQTLLEEYSKKAVRQKVDNALFILASLEIMPEELENCADKVVVNFPWGSLLGALAKGDKELISNISGLLKPAGEMEIVMGYSETYEPGEFERLGLPPINEETLEKVILPAFQVASMELTEKKILSKEDLGKIESSWGKKLEFGRERPFYLLKFVKK